jgi:hypothetical protein
MPMDKLAVLILIALAAIGLIWASLHSRKNQKNDSSPEK